MYKSTEAYLNKCH